MWILSFLPLDNDKNNQYKITCVLYLHIVNDTLSTESGCNLIPLYILSAVPANRITVTHRSFFDQLSGLFLNKDTLSIEAKLLKYEEKARR